MKPASNTAELKFSKSKQTGNKTMDASEYRASQIKESDLQRLCEEYLELKRIAYIRVPDAIYKAIFGTSSIKPHVKRLISSFIKGLPDLTLLKPIDDKYVVGRHVELKTAKGKQSQGQKTFATKLPVKIVRSFEEFQKVVKEFEEWRMS